MPVCIALFLAEAADMRDLREGGNGVMACGIIIAFVQAEMLRPLLRRLEALHHDALQRGGQERGIVDVGPSPGRAPRSTLGVPPQAAFHPFCPRSVGVRPPRSPPMRAVPMAASAACHGPSTPPNSSQVSTRTAQRRTQMPP